MFTTFQEVSTSPTLFLLDKTKINYDEADETLDFVVI